MSEAAAYPVFVWAVLACHGALSEPSPRRDALAIGALALAFFTRPQFLFLAAVLPLAALVARRPATALARHRLLAVAYVVGRVVVVIPLAALGETPPAARRLRRDRDRGLAAPAWRLEVGGDPPRRARGRARRRALSARRRLGVLESPQRAGRGCGRSRRSRALRCRCSRSRPPRTTSASAART